MLHQAGEEPICRLLNLIWYKNAACGYAWVMAKHTPKLNSVLCLVLLDWGLIPRRIYWAIGDIHIDCSRVNPCKCDGDNFGIHSVDKYCNEDSIYPSI